MKEEKGREGEREVKRETETAHLSQTSITSSTLNNINTKLHIKRLKSNNALPTTGILKQLIQYV